MTEPFFRRPRTAEEWRLRADRLKQHIDRLSIDELLRGVPLDEVSHDGVVGSYGHRYDPNQPRVPAGHSDGGQWTSKGGHGAGPTRSTNWPSSEGIIIRDFGGDIVYGARYASRRGGGGPGQLTPSQAARLAAAQADAREVIRRVRELEPGWRPQPSAYQTVEGLIRTYQAEAQQARQRYIELTYLTGPGRFAAEWIPSTGPGRLNSRGQREINFIGSIRGCHTCGRFNPGTRSGNFIGDHQEPTALNQLGRPQRRYPQCHHCSNVQGGKVRALMKKRGL